jgi:hypothetical protein
MYLNKTPYSSTMGHSLQGEAAGFDAVKASTHSWWDINNKQHPLPHFTKRPKPESDTLRFKQPNPTTHARPKPPALPHRCDLLGSKLPWLQVQPVRCTKLTKWTTFLVQPQQIFPCTILKNLPASPNHPPRQRLWPKSRKGGPLGAFVVRGRYPMGKSRGGYSVGLFGPVTAIVEAYHCCFCCLNGSVSKPEPRYNLEKGLIGSLNNYSIS